MRRVALEEVVLVAAELDGKELGRTVEKVLGKRNKLRSVTT